MIKMYITQLRHQNQNNFSEDQLNLLYPEDIYVPSTLKIIWQRHILWTRNYREFCLLRLGVFLDYPLETDDPGITQYRRNAFAIFTKVYPYIFHTTPSGQCWNNLEFIRDESADASDPRGHETIYPPYDEVIVASPPHPSITRVENLASSIGFDDILPIEHFCLDSSFYLPFKTHVCLREPLIRQLSAEDYDKLLHEYIKFMIILKTVVIGRNTYNPNFSEKYTSKPSIHH